MNKSPYDCLSEQDKEKAFKMYIDSLRPVNIGNESIVLLRVIHDGKNCNYLFPGQSNTEICEINLNWSCEHGIKEKQIVNFVTEYGFTGIKEIQVFTRNYHKTSKQYRILC